MQTRQRILATAVSLLLFTWQVTAQRPAFDVTSVKLNTSGGGGGMLGPRGNSFFATNMPLSALLMYAYRLSNGSMRDAQLIGGPDWARTDRFDIEGKPAGGMPVVPGEQTRLMVQSLLEDRFQVKVHRETRDLPVYNLFPAKKGPKLSEDQTPLGPGQSRLTVASPGEPLSTLRRGTLRMVNGPNTTTLTGTGIPLGDIILMLQSKSDRIIIDKTNLAGLMDVSLEFRPDLAAASESVPLFTALQDIGLKLEPAKAPLEVLVIDHAERPSPN